MSWVEYVVDGQTCYTDSIDLPSLFFPVRPNAKET